jgi:hypothetical protein
LPHDPKTGDVFEYAKSVPAGRAQLDALIQDARFAKRKRENMAALPSRGSNASSLSEDKLFRASGSILCISSVYEGGFTSVEGIRASEEDDKEGWMRAWMAAEAEKTWLHHQGLDLSGPVPSFPPAPTAIQSLSPIQPVIDMTQTQNINKIFVCYMNYFFDKFHLAEIVVFGVVWVLVWPSSMYKACTDLGAAS